MNSLSRSLLPLLLLSFFSPQAIASVSPSHRRSAAGTTPPIESVSKSLLSPKLPAVTLEPAKPIAQKISPAAPNRSPIAAPSLISQPQPVVLLKPPLRSIQASSPPPASPDNPIEPIEPIDLPPEQIEASPVLQRWLEEVPDVLRDIRRDPSFRTRLRLGYRQFSEDNASGLSVGIEDLFLGRSPFTLSADYQTAFAIDRQSYGANLRYYVLPLGLPINLAPQIGYRSIETRESIDGPEVGLRLLWVLSRSGAADLAITQSWINPGSDDQEVGLTSVTLGYAVSDRLRLSTDFQQQNAPDSKENRLGVGLEWLLP